MNLWEALGLTPQQGALAAATGLLAAFALAARVFVRRSRGSTRTVLDLDGRR